MSDSSDSAQVLDSTVISSDKMDEILGINMHYSEYYGRLSEMCKIEESVPDEILEDAYNSMAKCLSSDKGYNHFGPLNVRSQIIEKLLEIVVSHFIRKYNLEIDELEIQKEPELQWPLHDGDRMLSVQTDYAVVLNRPGSRKSHCLVVDCSTYPDGDVDKNLLFLKGLKELGDEKKELFGIITNEDNWVLTTFKDGSFKQCSRSCQSLRCHLAGTPNSKNFNEWLKEHSTLVKVLYSILNRELAPIYETADQKAN